MDSLHCLLYAHPSVRRNAVWMDEWINGGSVCADAYFARYVCDMAMARGGECFDNEAWWLGLFTCFSMPHSSPNFHIL